MNVGNHEVRGVVKKWGFKMTKVAPHRRDRFVILHVSPNCHQNYGKVPEMRGGGEGLFSDSFFCSLDPNSMSSYKKYSI